jgi:uncharacterized Tic20 family protein
MSDSLPPVPPSSPLPPEPPQPPPPPQGSGLSEANWALILHLSPLLALVVCCTPGTAIIAPLIIWLIKRTDSPTLDDVGKRVLNFQISYAIYSVGLVIVGGILSAIGIGWLLSPFGLALAIAWLVFTILGAVKQSNGETFQPPLVLELLK